MHRIAIIKDGFLASYREPLFEGLNRIPGREYVVFYGDPPEDLGFQKMKESYPFPTVKVRNRTFRLLGRRLFYQPLIWKVVFGGFHAVVLGYEVRLLSNFVILELCRLVGKPVLYWGHGFEKTEDGRPATSPLTKLTARLKLALARRASGYIAYTNSGRRFLLDHGFPEEHVAVARNTIDMAEHRALHARFADRDPAELRRRFGVSDRSVVLMFIGRLYTEKRAGELLEAAAALKARGPAAVPIEVLVIGRGQEEAALKARFGNLQGVHWLGAVSDEEAAAALRIAAAVVIPGKVGLAANHAFAYGVPLITRASELHAPEVEYVADGVNGLIVKGNFDRFVDALAEFAASGEMQARLSAGALESREKLTLDHTVKAYDRAVVAAIERRAGRTAPTDRLQRDPAG
jgi:glycosyltransferase involved in cell wall biosynthesis